MSDFWTMMVSLQPDHDPAGVAPLYPGGEQVGAAYLRGDGDSDSPVAVAGRADPDRGPTCATHERPRYCCPFRATGPATDVFGVKLLIIQRAPAVKRDVVVRVPRRRPLGLDRVSLSAVGYGT